MFRLSSSDKALLVIIFSIIFFNFYYFPENILSWDVFGYYSYLPMIFIYDNWGLQDMSLVKKIVETYHNSTTLYQFFIAPTGFWIMRYPMGLSYLYFPFFLMGHLVALFTNYPADGYSFPYQLAILIGGIVYSIVGFIYIKKILSHYFDDIISSISLLIIYFGTNYLITCSVNGNNAASHNYLFTLYAVLIFYTIKWHQTFEKKYIFLLSAIVAIQILCRPSELVSILIPLFWNVGNKYSLKQKISILYIHRNDLLICILISLLIWMPQLIYWKIIGGKFLFNSYYMSNPGEAIDLDNPHLIDVLFSFRKGWFIYTPIMIFAIIGMFITNMKKQPFAYSVAFYFVINLYLVSCWTIWWNGSSFSQRYLVQSYPALALSLATFLEYSFNMKRIKMFTIIILLLLVSLNLFQSWQYQNGIIHESGMTKKAYLAAFLKLHKPEKFEEMLQIDLLNYLDPNLRKIDSTKYFKSKEWNIDYTDSPIGLQLDSNKIYSPPFSKIFNELTSNDHVKLLVKTITKNTRQATENPLTLVITLQHDGKNYGYYSLDIHHKEDTSNVNGWDTTITTYLNPPIRNIRKDNLSIYFWLRGKYPVFIKKIKIEVWENKVSF